MAEYLLPVALNVALLHVQVRLLPLQAATTSYNLTFPPLYSAMHFQLFFVSSMAIVKLQSM